MRKRKWLFATFINMTIVIWAYTCTYLELHVNNIVGMKLSSFQINMILGFLSWIVGALGCETRRKIAHIEFARLYNIFFATYRPMKLLDFFRKGFLCKFKLYPCQLHCFCRKKNCVSYLDGELNNYLSFGSKHTKFTCLHSLLNRDYSVFIPNWIPFPPFKGRRGGGRPKKLV